MIASFASGLLMMLCAACAMPANEAPLLYSSPEHVVTIRTFNASEVSTPARSSPLELLGSLTSGYGFRLAAWPESKAAARLDSFTLALPRPVRELPGERWIAEVSVAASAERTGLGFDLSIAPRAEIQRYQAGGNAVRAGAEFRVGANLLANRDQRGTAAPAPSWYFFIGADDEALVWNVADRHAVNGVSLRDQATVGDLQAGLAWTMKTGGQVSVGVVERDVEFNDLAGENDVNREDRFAALSFTLRH